MHVCEFKLTFSKKNSSNGVCALLMKNCQIKDANSGGSPFRECISIDLQRELNLATVYYCLFVSNVFCKPGRERVV